MNEAVPRRIPWDIVWATANDDVPVLRRQVLEMLQTEALEQPEK